MMSQSSPSQWAWDVNRQDYYYVTIDASGNYCYHFQKEETPVASSIGGTYEDQSLKGRNDSVLTEPASAPADIREQQPNFIRGDPENGWTEGLDSSYRMRTGSEAYNFFRVGKVFSMLHIQAASANELAPISDNITVVKYGERAFSQIRRFVIVEVRRGYVYACPISTYSRRGTLKHGCVPSEHSVVYLSGTAPTTFAGEMEGGLCKEPIAVIPADVSVQMHPASRIHYAKSYPIEMNVKVKDIGDVEPAHLSLILRYYREENSFQDNGSNTSYTTPQYSTSRYPISQNQSTYANSQTSYTYSTPYITPISAHDVSSAVGEDHRGLNVPDTEFEIVHNPKAFFKKGRVFMTPWPEPAGDAVRDQTGPRVSVNIQTFVVIRPQHGHCTCLPINTYGGQGTRKPGVIARDHAAVVAHGDEPPKHSLEPLTKSPIFLKVENESIGPVDPMSRINFAKVYTVEDNMKVRNIGRIVPESIHRMDEYFKESFKFGTV
ncbi:hypothetical protein DPSP01_013954 [Paraphaeosphaeria sporulosa]